MMLISLHGDGSPHRTHTYAGFTDDPWAFYVPASTQIVESSGKHWSSDYPVVALFWPNRYYQVMLLLKAGVTDYYCNVIAPPVYDSEQDAVLFRDLDIDVLLSDAGISVVDLDEFEQRKIHYPNEWVEGALLAKEALVQLADRREGPFSPATARKWRAWVQERSGCPENRVE